MSKYQTYIYKPLKLTAEQIAEWKNVFEKIKDVEIKVPGVLSGDLPTEGRQEPPTSCLLDVTGRTDTKSLFGV